MSRIDPALKLGLRATFTPEELRQLHDDATNEQDAVTNRDPWLRLVGALYFAAYPEHCAGGCSPAETTKES